MKIKLRPKKKKLRLPLGAEAEEVVQHKRLPQLNKYFKQRAIYGFGQG